ncbi:MAG: hypothetical protein RIS62_451 [Chloroflexota bacterium]|jgi:hypothetical protein
MELTYAPGACNIGPEEIDRRRKAAVAGLVASVGFAAALIFGFGSAPGGLERLLVALPLTGAAIGWIQARRRFCMAYGLAGTFNLGKIGEMSRVTDQAALAADRRTALIIAAQGLAIGVGGALLFLVLPIAIQR